MPAAIGYLGQQLYDGPTALYRQMSRCTVTDTHSYEHSTDLVESFLEAGLVSERTEDEVLDLLEGDRPLDALAVVLEDRGL